MLRDQYSSDLESEIFLHNFAGGGGARTGIEMRLGDGAAVGAPTGVIEGGYASHGLLACIVVNKYLHHLPLYAAPGIIR